MYSTVLYSIGYTVVFLYQLWSEWFTFQDVNIVHTHTHTLVGWWQVGGEMVCERVVMIVIL